MKMHSDLKPADVVTPRSKTPGAQQLFEYLQHINDEVGAVAHVGHTGKGMRFAGTIFCGSATNSSIVWGVQVMPLRLIAGE